MKIKNILLLLSFVSLVSFPGLLYASEVAQKEPANDIILIMDNSRPMKTLDRDAIAGFIGSLKADTQLGIISFEEKAEIIFALQPLSTDIEKKAAQNSLKGLVFKRKFKDINKGLGLAFSQFSGRGRKGATKIVLLLSDGRIFSAARRQRDASIKELRQSILSNYLDEGITVYALSYGKADLKLMQEVAHKTNGRHFLAYGNEVLGDILLTIKERIEPVVIYSTQEVPVETVIMEQAATVYSVPPVFLYVIAILLLFFSVLTFIIVFSSAKRENQALRAGQRRHKNEAGVGHISEALSKLEASLKSLQLDIEDYGARNWKKETESRQKYYNILNALFLFLDHLDISLKNNKNIEQIDRIYKRVASILEGESIEEIAVQKGERFDGKFHKHAGERANELAKGAILEVTRKGYFIKHTGTEEEDIILRPAEVIVSAGLS